CSGSSRSVWTRSSFLGVRSRSRSPSSRTRACGATRPSRSRLRWCTSEHLSQPCGSGLRHLRWSAGTADPVGRRPDLPAPPLLHQVREGRQRQARCLMAATFPVHYEPRPYQAAAHKMWRTKRFGVVVWSRQSGKDVAMSMEMCEARLRQPKTTGVYISLDNPLIRDILWDKTYSDPVTGEYVQMLQDNVPAELVDWKNTFMVGQFTNGSRLKLQGYFQSGRGKNGVGTSFQDYAFTELALFTREDPIPLLMPILTNGPDKRLLVASTPRGKRRNPLWQLMESLRGNPEYGEIVWGINDLNEMMRREGLPPIRTEAELERTRDAYLKRFGNDRMFNQEFHVDFAELDAAAVYGEAYLQMLRDGRVTDFQLHPGHPVFVVFDIGSSGAQSDATSWIAFQWYNDQLFLFDCGEGHGKALPEYVDILREKPWFSRVAQIILPWDGEHHEKA